MGDGVRVREGDVVGVSEGVDVGEPVMELEPVGESDGLELGVMVTLGVRDKVGVVDAVAARTPQHNTWGHNGVRVEAGDAHGTEAAMPESRLRGKKGARRAMISRCIPTCGSHRR